VVDGGGGGLAGEEESELTLPMATPLLCDVWLGLDGVDCCCCCCCCCGGGLIGMADTDPI